MRAFNHLRRFIVILLGVMTVAPAVFAQSATFRKEPLQIESDGKRHSFTVELALTPEQRAQGLMYRQSMAVDAGMLFLEEGERDQLMWMRNTYIPLDMVFIRADGTIHHIHARAVPKTDTTITSHGPVKGVLELNGGTASRLGLKPGDKVIHPAFGTR